MDSINRLNQEKATPNATMTVAVSIVHSFFGAGFGYLASRITSVVKPSPGIIFGAASGAAWGLSDLIFSQIFGDSNIEKVATFILKFIASTGFAVLVVTLAGFAIPLKAAIILSATMLGLQIITNLILKKIISD